MKDFYLMHYTYYFSNSTQKGEGTLYLATNIGIGVRKADIDGATATVAKGLANLDPNVVVVPSNICYLTTCTDEDFYAD